MIRLSIDRCVERLAERLSGLSAPRIFIPFGPGEPLGLRSALAARPELVAGACLVGAPIPGLNQADWTGLIPGTRSEGIFVSNDWREAFEAGRFALRPMTWFQTYGWLKTTPLDAAVFQVSPPGPDGTLSLSVASDLSPAVLGRSGLLKMAVINPNLPWVSGPSALPDQFDLVCRDEGPVSDYDAGDLDPAFERIAARIAEATPDGASLQFGVGKAGVAALKGLRGRRGLKIHSGMVTNPLIALLDEEVVDGVVTGLAAGTAALRSRLGDPRLQFRDSGHTHDIRVLAAIPRLVAVNSALEIDLFGQANAEFQDGRQVSGIGGLTDFLRGARLSDGGVPILALPASARKDSISRIVPRLSPGAVSVPRADVAVIITEHGTADLRGLDLDARAQALIGVASPAHRDSLSGAWDRMRASL
jgi:acyl-CoA hydrolase